MPSWEYERRQSRHDASRKHLRSGVPGGSNVGGCWLTDPMTPTATPPIEWADGVVEGVLIDEDFVDDGWLEAAFAGPSAWPDEPWLSGAERTDEPGTAADPANADEVALAGELARIVALERSIRAAQAEQFWLVESARLRHARLEGVTEGSSSEDREFATRSFVAEVATTLVVPEATAGRLVADSTRLTGARSATLDALAADEISGAHVRAMLEVTSSLPADAADEVERVALQDAGSRTSAGFRRRLHRLRERLHPEPLVDRHARAATERRVAHDPAPDGMAWLSLFLQADRAVAIMARLESLADSGDTHRPDTRTTMQRRADLAADLLRAGTRDSSDRHLAAATGRVAGKIVVTVPVLTLLGASDEPAELDGYGPIDGHRPTPGRARTVAAPAAGAPRDRRRTLLRAHHLPRGSRPRRVRAGPRRRLPLPRLRAPRHQQRPRPQHRVGTRRPNRRRQPRHAVPIPSPAQAPHRLADATRPRRHHPLDLTHRTPAPNPPGATVHHGRTGIEARTPASSGPTAGT